jgi:endonuclease/exonuclease/phosphatase family metal-dependent hydrolase
MERRERGFFGKVLVFILTILAVIGLIAMTLSVICPHIDPKHFGWIPFFGLTFWVILLFNVLVFFALLLLWSRKAWISLIALLVAIPGINKSYSFGKKIENEEGIRVMSYNLYMFHNVDRETDSETTASKVFKIVREQSPDLLCCQEFAGYNRRVTRNQCIAMFSDSIGMPYVYYNKKSNYGGNVIFSKYPIEKVTTGGGFSNEETYGVLVEVDAGAKGKFYLANIHLVSNMITRSEIDVLTSTPENQQSFDTVGRSVYHKLQRGYILRSDEVKEMLQGIPEVDLPVILCGDFNDTPLSYTCRRIQKAGYSDAFSSVGHGIKPTYSGDLPLLRIDYFWVNDKVMPLRFNRYRQKLSDHYPIILDFSINKQ